MRRARFLLPGWACVVAVWWATSAKPQNPIAFDRARAESMLQTIEYDLKKNYYDPNFHGVDLNARFNLARDKIRKAETLGFALSDIAGALDALNDSHTFFMPPPRPYTHDFGFHMQMVGEDNCMITVVRPGRDAEAKGLKPGDRLLAIQGYQPTRENLWKMKYVYNVLRPQPQLRLKVSAPDGTVRDVDVVAKMQQRKLVVDLTGQDIWDEIRQGENDERLRRSRYYEIGDVLIWKLPDFARSRDYMDDMLKKASKRKSWILDLRGNPGGSVDALREFIGGLFDRDIKMADRAGRKEMKPEVAKSRGHNTFSGQLIVLVDSDSGSAAELLARIVQLEKRATVLGDRSAGAVMEARHFPYKSGTDVVTFYAASITVADLIMSDGKSLEKVGVMPDERIVPTPADLAAGRDPVMARAAELTGLKLSATEAGKLFPVEFPRD